MNFILLGRWEKVYATFSTLIPKFFKLISIYLFQGEKMKSEDKKHETEDKNNESMITDMIDESYLVLVDVSLNLT